MMTMHRWTRRECRPAAIGLRATIAGFMLASPLGAQPSLQRTDTTRVLPLNEIVVSVTRTGWTLRELPANVTVLSKPVLAASAAQTVPDLLREIPGFTMRDYQSTIAVHPTRQAPALRGIGGGTSASRTLVLVDGVPVADPFAGWVHWARVPLEFVDRIEVVRGGGSGIWGSRAMGGVINLITERPTASGARLSVQGGSLSTVRADGAATWRTDRLGVAVMGEHFDTDGFIGVREDLRTSIDTEAGTKHDMAYAKLEYEVSPTVALHVNGSWLDEERAAGTPERETTIDLRYVRGGVHVALGEASALDFIAFASGQDYTQTFSTESADRESEIPALDQFDVPATSAGANLQWSTRALTRHELTAGADIFWVDGEVNEDFLWAADRYTRRRAVGGTQVLGGTYVQDVLRLSERTRLLASGRYDFARNRDGFRIEWNTVTDAVLVDTAYAAESHNTLNFSLGLRHDLSDRLSWRGSVYRAYRAPTLNELYKPFREPGNIIVEGNADLEAERTLGAEVGADWTIGSAALARITAFWSRIDSPIVEATVEQAGPTNRNIAPCGFVPAGGVCKQRRNLGEFRSTGVETEFELHAGEHWMLRGSYIFNPTEITESPEDASLEGKQGSRSPEHAFTSTVRWANPAILDAAVTGRYVGKRFEDDLNSLELDSFFLLDVRISKTVQRHVDVFGSIENVFDVEYETARASTGLVRTGGPRIALVGVRWRATR